MLHTQRVTRCLSCTKLRAFRLPQVLVAQASDEEADRGMRSYAHCGANGGLALMLLNLNSTVSSTIHLDLALADLTRLEYHFSADGDIFGTGIRLNEHLDREYSLLMLCCWHDMEGTSYCVVIRGGQQRSAWKSMEELS